MLRNLYLAYDVRAENAVHVRIYVYVKFLKRECSSEVWCYVNDVSYGIIVLLF